MLLPTDPPRYLLITGDVVAQVYFTLSEAMEAADLLTQAMRKESPLGGFYGSVDVCQSLAWCPEPQCDDRTKGMV